MDTIEFRAQEFKNRFVNDVHEKIMSCEGYRKTLENNLKIQLKYPDKILTMLGGHYKSVMMAHHARKTFSSDAGVLKFACADDLFYVLNDLCANFKIGCLWEGQLTDFDGDSLMHWSITRTPENQLTSTLFETTTYWLTAGMDETLDSTVENLFELSADEKNLSAEVDLATSERDSANAEESATSVECAIQPVENKQEASVATEQATEKLAEEKRKKRKRKREDGEKKKEKKKKKKESSSDFDRHGFRLVGCDTEFFLNHIQKHTADEIRDSVSLFTEHVGKIRNIFEAVISFVNQLQKLYENIPYEFDPRTREIITPCTGCRIHCVPHWNVPAVPGRPKKHGIIDLKKKDEI